METRKKRELKLCFYPPNAKEYDVYRQIGKGAFAKVYPAIIRKTNQKVAIKVFDLDTEDPTWDQIQSEITTLRQLDHKNVIEIFTSFIQLDTLWIVMPLFAGGSCADIIRSGDRWKKGFKDETLIATILRSTLEALKYFHGQAKIHRDIKAGNILISEDGDVKLADFGVARGLIDGSGRQKVKTFTGTPCWMAPEIMEQTESYDTKADIWSFGITMMEMGYGRAPYGHFKPMKVILLTLQEDPPTTAIYDDNSYKFSMEYEKVIAACLKKNPKERPTAAKLLAFRFFRKAKSESYIKETLIDTEDKKDLFKEKLDMSQVRSQELTKKGKPVPLPKTFRFEDDELTKIKNNDEEKLKSENLSAISKVDLKSTKKGRFIVTTQVQKQQESQQKIQQKGRFLVENHSPF